MKKFATLAAILSLPMLGACESKAERQADATENRIERQADASAAAAGSTPAALGLTEMQLLEADLVTADGTDLGDVEQVHRNADGTVQGVLVEIENSDPDRFVFVPIDGLSTRLDGDDTDLQTTMTAAELAALPDGVNTAR